MEGVDRDREGVRRESEPPTHAPRVLHFLCTPDRAGVGEHALSLLAALRTYGFVPYIVAPAPLLEAATPELNKFAVNSFAMDMSSPLDWREIGRLSTILRRERIDIVHSHMAIASACASPIARLSGVPALIETAHGREIWREGKRIKGSFWFDRQVGRITDRFIAVSEAVARHLQENKRIPGHKITVIHNGRDISQFRPSTPAQTFEARAELDLKQDAPVILMLARFSVEKGHRLLIDSVRELIARRPRLVVLLAGDGPARSQNALHSLWIRRQRKIPRLPRGHAKASGGYGHRRTSFQDRRIAALRRGSARIGPSGCRNRGWGNARGSNRPRDRSARSPGGFFVVRRGRRLSAGLPGIAETHGNARP